MPWIAANLNSKIAALSPDLAMIGLFVMMVLLGRVRMTISLVSIVMILLIGTHSSIAILDGRGIGSGGLVMIVLEVFIFYKLLEASPNAVTPEVAARWVARIYKLHLLFLSFELVACLAGLRDFFVGIAGASTVTTIYKTYNTAALLNYFDYPGLNSLLLGSQSASQLVLFALYWFVTYRYRAIDGLQDRWNIIWVTLALVMYPVNATMTSNALLAILIFTMLLLFRRLRNVGLKTALILSPFVLFFAEEFVRLFLFRLLEEKDIEIYYAALEVPIQVFSEIGLYRQLLGWGAFIDEFLIDDTNFGLGTIVFQVGALITTACFACIAIFWKRLVIASKNLECGTPQTRIAAYMTVANGLLALAWFVSIVHYTTAIELGGRQILAFHAALALFFGRFLVSNARPFSGMMMDAAPSSPVYSNQAFHSTRP